MKINIIIIAVAAVVLVCGCKNKGAKAAGGQHPMQVVVEGFTDTIELELVPMDDEPAPAPTESYFEKKARTATSSASGTVATKAKSASQNTQPETIYVETDGAQGRVWGHVTMKGDRGSGTIHDWDENTLTVTVTRHGDELFAVDQNSRQYVFKLKK